MRFDVVVRRDEDDYYVATVPELPGCHTQAKSLDDLMSRIKEAILLYLETKGSRTVGCFVGGPGCSSRGLLKPRRFSRPWRESAIILHGREASNLVKKHPDGRSTVVPVHLLEGLEGPQGRAGSPAATGGARPGVISAPLRKKNKASSWPTLSGRVRGLLKSDTNRCNERLLPK